MCCICRKNFFGGFFLFVVFSSQVIESQTKGDSPARVGIVKNFKKFFVLVCFCMIYVKYNNNIIYYDEYDNILMKYIDIVLI